jgi:hypothetical protein
LALDGKATADAAQTLFHVVAAMAPPSLGSFGGQGWEAAAIVLNADGEFGPVGL